MIPTLNRSFIKRYVRLLLALFVLSVVNMSMQIPAHAAMQQSMQNVMQQQSMAAGAEMQHCKCPPTICEKVESLSDQGIEGMSSINLSHLLGFQSIYFNLIGDLHQQPSVLRLNHHEWQYRQASPPPLSISSILHI